MTQYIFPGLFAFVITFWMVLTALKYFPKWGLMDRPLKYGLKRKPIPYYGGIIIYIGFVLSVLIFVKIDFTVLAFLGGATLIAGVSFLDDLFSLSPVLRLGVQILSAVILVVAGIGIHSLTNPLGGTIALDSWIININTVYQLSVFAALFTVFWVVAIVNTMNFLDGLNGLVSGVSVIAGFSIFLLSVRPGIHYDVSSQVPVAIMSIILFGVALAFWMFDFYPAKILMGDTGSMFLGFVIAVLAIFSGGKIATAFLVMGAPILDAFWVIFRRIIRGKSPLKGDLRHFHHRLLYTGLSDRKALFLIYFITAFFGGIAVFLEGIDKLYAIMALVILMMTLGFVAVKYEKK